MKVLLYGLMIYISMSSISLYSQSDDYRVAEIVCGNKDYQFKVEGGLYFSGRKIYVCPKNLPVEVLVVRSDGQPISAATIFQWKLNGVTSIVVGNPISLKESDFKGDVVKLQCNFDDNGPQSLKVKILKNIVLKFSEKEKNYQFDDNKIQAYRDKYYPGTPINVPWNFIKNGSFDKLNGKSKKKKGYYAINSIVSNNTKLSIVPSSMSSAKTEITLSMQTGNMNHVIEVMGCNTDPELLVYTNKEKKYDIEFYHLCDTDDDIQVLAVGDMAMSPDDVCIDGGLDQTLDEGESIRKGDDVYQMIGGKESILVGPNLKCDSKIHKPDPNDECPTSFDFTPSFEVMEKLFKKVGVKFKNLGFQSVIKMNYNTHKEDGALSGSEQKDILEKLVGGPPVPTSDGVIRVYLVQSLGVGSTGVGTAQGRAVFKSNIVILSSSEAGDFTLPHEIGHAIWGLKHPGDPALGEFQINDLNNFMHGISNEVIKFGIRRYQFGIINP